MQEGEMLEHASFGAWVQRRRKALDLTQAELAERVGCALGTIRKIETDERRPSKQIAARLADQLQLAPEGLAVFLKAARAEVGLDQLAPPTELVPPMVAAALLPRGTVTFLFTDIEGSTQLWERRPQAMGAAVARHEALLREAITAAGGVIFKLVGDAVCAAFASAQDALTAAVAAQRALQAEAWGATGPLGVRMALHTGVVEERGGDYFGLPLSRVARLLSAGHGGQILLSLAAEELVREQLPPEVALRDLGIHRLKDLSLPEQIFQVVAPDLPSSFAPLQTLDTQRTNLPAQPTPLIGRGREIAATTALLRRADVRLVTLSGPGGTGKTRLGLQVAAELALTPSPSAVATGAGSEMSSPPRLPQWERGSGGEGHFPDGVYFVNLAPISDPTLVATTIAHALGVAEAAGRPVQESLHAFLRAKRMLLLLDNFEQVLDAAPLVAELLAAAPGLKVLITSRAVLHLSGEHEFAVPSLALPPKEPRTGTRRVNQEPKNQRTREPENQASSIKHQASSIKNHGQLTTDNGQRTAELTQYDAVKLFIARAQAARANFTVTNDDAPAVAEICYRLDGLPLAIELAAARIKFFSPEALLARLERRLQVLTGGPRDLPVRQQTLRNTIDWSYNLLEPAEQALFRRLGVFVGGCTLEAAEAVSDFGFQISDFGLGEIGADNPKSKIQNCLDGLTGLVDKSLLRQEEGLDGEPRFTMLETVSEYAIERLEESGEAESIRRQHANYFLALAEAAELHRYTATQGLWLRRLDAEHDNMRVALAWSQTAAASADAGARLAGALQWFWYIRRYKSEGRAWLERALEHTTSAVAPARAKALYGAGRFQSDRGRANTLIEQALALWRELGDKPGMADALLNLGRVARVQGDYERSGKLIQDSLALFREQQIMWGIVWALISHADVALDQGDPEQALAPLQEALALTQSLGDTYGNMWARCLQGRLAHLQGNLELAAMLLEESLAWLRSWGSPSVFEMLNDLGRVAFDQGDIDRATALFEESLKLSWEPGNEVDITFSLVGLAGVAGALGQPARAIQLLGAAGSIRASSGRPLTPVERTVFNRYAATMRAQLGDATFAAMWAEGEQMSLEQAKAVALGGCG
jgi:predicted ATPase/class 3 adenylate cyclase